MNFNIMHDVNYIEPKPDVLLMYRRKETVSTFPAKSEGKTPHSLVGCTYAIYHQ